MKIQDLLTTSKCRKGKNVNIMRFDNDVQLIKFRQKPRQPNYFLDGFIIGVRQMSLNLLQRTAYLTTPFQERILKRMEDIIHPWLLTEYLMILVMIEPSCLE